MLVLLPYTTFALDFTFGDSVNHWNTWNSSDSDGLYNGIPDDNYDTIGDPDLTGGEGTITAGNLTAVDIFYTHYDPIVGAGDLFIDVGSNSYWDYVLTAGGDIYQFADLTFSALKGGVNNDLYDVTTTWSGYYIRNDHPYGLDETGLTIDNNNDVYLGTSLIGAYLGEYDFSGFDGDGSINFSGFSLPMGDKAFILGFAVTCANDVIYEKVAPVPEPATILLVGSGLIGIAGFRRKFKMS